MSQDQRSRLGQGSSPSADDANRSGVVSAAAGTSRSRSDQPGWRIARPSAAMISFLRSNACRIAPTSRSAGNKRVKERRSGIKTSSGTSSSRCLRDRPIARYAVANRATLVGRRSSLTEPRRSRPWLRRGCRSRRARSPPGATRSGRNRAGRLFPPCSTVEVPFKPIRMVNRS